MKRSTLAVACILVGAVAAFAQTAPRSGTTSPATTTAPRLGTTTTTSKAAVDRSTPAKTWAALCAAVKAGDLAGFRASCYNKNEISKLFMDAYSDTLISSFQLATAVAKLGAEGQTLSKSLQSSAYDDLVKSGQNRTTKIDGDSAQWIQSVTSTQISAQQTMYFKKVGNDWLLDTEKSYGLDTSDSRKGAEEFIKDSDATLKQLHGVITDIDAKKITTVQQMKDRMSGK